MSAVDVLVVGAGPTGLALAAQLLAYGATVRIVDRRDSPVRDSRALVVQPRTLEVLRPTGVTAALLERGDMSASARLHLNGRAITVPLHDLELHDTPYPLLLVLRQADLEAAMASHLRAQGLDIEWATEFRSCRAEGATVTARLRARDGGGELVRASYVAGCDGAGSTVRSDVGIAFEGGDYRQSVLLADVALEGELSADRVQAFVSPHGGIVLFHGGEHAPWRLIHIRGRRARAGGPPRAEDVVCEVEAVTGGRVHVAEVRWLTDIALQHRLATRFRAGRVVLAGDAAHVHSPAGARGMNTGIQDASNLGWKLALAARGAADEGLVHSYAAERRFVARTSMALTHLIFFAEAADHPALRRARAAVAPLAVPVALQLAWLRAMVFHVIGQLGVRYPRGAVAVEGRPRLRRGPGAGCRMPDAPLSRAGARLRLHDLLSVPGFHLLLCGPRDAWDEERLAALDRRYEGMVTVHRLGTPRDGCDLTDTTGALLHRLGVRGAAQYAIRPDGHVAYRCAGTELAGLERQLAGWLRGRAPALRR